MARYTHGIRMTDDRYRIVVEDVFDLMQEGPFKGELLNTKFNLIAYLAQTAIRRYEEEVARIRQEKIDTDQLEQDLEFFDGDI